ncbi:hypothetical protein ACFQY4_26965 [Catellatospora bangladeshensis]|uniref:hypothetical protein n=1 Tax=Catellatospora bangladeshensis TaxID=310355 RepID=UPI00360719AE
MHRALKRRTTLVVGVAVALTMFSACTPAEAPKPIATPGVEPTGTVELWHFFTDREAKALDDTLARFKAKYPKVTLTVKGGQDDAKVTTAIGAAPARTWPSATPPTSSASSAPPAPGST